MQDKEYFEEISYEKTKKFPFDRIYYPDDGIPKSPIVIRNKVCNEKNNYFYSRQPYTNANNTLIYECNEEGKYLKIENDPIYNEDGTYSVSPIVIDDPSTSITNIRDDRIVPYTPLYNSCKDWFTSEFYVDGVLANPFWQIINFAPTFSQQAKKFEQVCTIKSYQKLNNNLILQKVSEDEAYFEIEKSCFIDSNYTANYINITYPYDYINLLNGELNFLILPKDNTFTNTPLPMKFGVQVENSFYKGKRYSFFQRNTDPEGDPNEFERKEKDSFRLQGSLAMSYTVNTKQNFATNDKDSAIASITELGIYDKNHTLLAYANFPPINYRSDTQHLSFICIINKKDIV
jgi:hypothetical protein